MKQRGNHIIQENDFFVHFSLFILLCYFSGKGGMQHKMAMLRKKGKNELHSVGEGRHLELEHALGASVELMVTLRLLPSGQGRVAVNLLQNLPQVGGLLSRDGHLISTLGSQEQQTIDQVCDLDISKGSRVSDIVSVGAVLGQVGLVDTDKLGEDLDVQLVGFLDTLVLGGTDDLLGEGLGDTVSRGEDLLDLVGLVGVLAVEAELVGEVALDGLGLGQFEDGAVLGGLVDDGEALEGSVFLLVSPVL